MVSIHFKKRTALEKKKLEITTEYKLHYKIQISGFYEWKTFKDQSKQPYLIYAKQNHDQSPTIGNCQDSKILQCYLRNQKLECLSNNWKEDYGWTGTWLQTQNRAISSNYPHSYTPYLPQIVYIAGQKPLFMAGIYSKWNPNSSSSQNTLSNTVYSYTIITR